VQDNKDFGVKMFSFSLFSLLW